MRKRIRILFAVLIVAVVGGIGWVVLRSREPVYQGRRLTAWMEQYEKYCMARKSPEKEQRDQAESAIRQIGTNALPTLLGMVRARDSTLKTKILALLSHQSVIKLSLHPADYYHAKATYGFGVLGAIAKPAIPALIDLLHDKDREIQADAAQCLSLIGPEAEEAVSALIQLLNDTGNGNGIVLMNSMMALGCIHAKPEIVVPLLIEYVDGPRKDWNYGVPAMDALARYRDKAKPAFSAILSQLNDPDESHKRAAFSALWRIDPEAAGKARVK